MLNWLEIHTFMFSDVDFCPLEDAVEDFSQDVFFTVWIGLAKVKFISS
jgi:hypothetical protein